MKKMNMKWLSLLLAVLVMMTVLAPMAFAEAEVDPDANGGEASDVVLSENETEADAEDKGEDEAAKKMIFEPLNFVKNLGYMGVGMLGIFIVIGIIIIAVVVLNKVTAPKKKENE